MGHGRSRCKVPLIPRLELPAAAPLIRVMAMPEDANPNGDVFGGWLLAQMDLVGGTLAVQWVLRHGSRRQHGVPRAGLCRR